MIRNYKKEVFDSLIPVFSQPQMRINIEKFREYLDYTFNSGLDISYEEFLGVGVKPKLPISMEHIEQAINLASKAKTLFFGGILKRK